MATTVVSARWELSRIEGNGMKANVGHVVNEPIQLPLPVKVLAITYPAASSEIFEYIRIGFSGSFMTSQVTTTNATSVTYRVNGNIVSGTVTLAEGDDLRVDVVRTVSANAATVNISITYDDSTDSKTTPNYQWATWTNLANMSVDSTTWNATKRGLVAAVNGTGLFDKGANSVDSLQGLFSLETEFLSIGNIFGISTTNNSTAWLFRAKYSWYCAAPNLLRIAANGSFIDAIFVTANNSMSYELRVTDTGTGIQFHYKPPGGSWTLKTTTTASYSANTTYYADMVMLTDFHRCSGVKLFT